MEQKKDEFTTCPKCGHLIKYHSNDTYWNEHGYGYSTKLINCSICEVPIVLEYEEDDWLKEV